MNATKRDVAVIGLGSMGWGAALSLMRSGFAVRGLDIRDDVLARFAAEGGIACRTAAEAAAGADVLLVFVVDAKQTDAVLFGETGALAGAAPGTVIASCATTPPSYAARLGERLVAADMLPVDAPVSGGAARAQKGEMTIMCACSDAAFDKAKAVLDAIATKIYRLGEVPGIGSQFKMINQLLAGIHIAATAEALTLGAKLGLDLHKLYEVICASAGASWMFENRGPQIVEGDYTPFSAVDIFVKDLGIVRRQGEEVDFPLPLAETAHAPFEGASADATPLSTEQQLQLLRQMAGVLRSNGRTSDPVGRLGDHAGVGTWGGLVSVGAVDGPGVEPLRPRHPGRRSPPRPLRGAATGPGPRDPADRRAPRRPAGRTHPGPRLPRQTAVRRAGAPPGRRGAGGGDRHP
jgi:3-hydroxyisobutyrate dehydrogenase